MREGAEKSGGDGGHGTLARSLACAGCGYDLRGLGARGRCPECGHAIWSSIQAALDPTARRLPTLRNPRRVGDALLGLVAALLLAALLVVLGWPLVIGLGMLGAAGDGRWRGWMSIAAGVVLLVGLIPVRALAPPAGEERGGPVRRDLRWLAVGLVAIAAGSAASGVVLLGAGASVGAWRHVVQLIMVAATWLTLARVRRLLKAIGERSRQFRTAQGSRQRVRELIVVVIGVGVGTLLDLLAPAAGPLSGVGVLGRVLVGTCSFMLVLGLLYLLVNASWIRRALRQPPPTLRELFGGEGCHLGSPGPAPGGSSQGGPSTGGERAPR